MISQLVIMGFFRDAAIVLSYPTISQVITPWDIWYPDAAIVLFCPLASGGISYQSSGHSDMSSHNGIFSRCSHCTVLSYDKSDDNTMGYLVP